MTRVWSILRIELLQVLRTREVYSFGVLPATLGFPLLVVGTLIVMSFVPDTRLLLPEQDPEGIGLSRHLDREFELVRSADPRAAYEAGEADVAVLAWAPEPDGTVSVEALARDAEAAKQLKRELNKAVWVHLEDRVEAAGGSGADLHPARVSRPSPLELRIDGREALWVFLVFLATYMGCFLLPARGVSERSSGGLEALVVTPTPVALVFGTRVLVTSALITLILGLPMVGPVMILPRLDELIQFEPLDPIELFVTIGLMNVGFLAVGLLTSSVRLAIQYASALLLTGMPVWGAALWYAQPWVPLIGFAEAGMPAQLFRILMTLAASALGIAVLGWLSTGERALPPGEGDE